MASESEHEPQFVNLDNENEQLVEREDEGESQLEREQPPVPNNEQQRQGSRFDTVFALIKSLVFRGLIIYGITSLFRRGQPVLNESNVSTHVRLPATNLFENGTIFDMYMYLSENENYVNFDDPKSLIWNRTKMVYGDWTSGPNYDGSYTTELEFSASQKVQKNGSIFLHTYIMKHNANKLTIQLNDSLMKQNVIHSTKRLNKYKKRSFVKTQNLLTGETAASPEDVEKAKTMSSEIVSHWHPNITVCLVIDSTAWIYGSVPSPVNKYIEFIPGANLYKPVIFYNDFWNMKRDYIPMNDSIKTLSLRVTYQPITLFKWQIFLAQSSRSKWGGQFYGDSQSEVDEEDQDSLKEMLLETSPYLIAATVIVSILHSVFELLAFKNDIQFWNNRESLEGLSVRLVFFNVFQSAIVFLYVLDNDGNLMITLSCFIGLLIEVWKIKKVVDFTVHRDIKILGIFPKISMKDKGSYVESSTKEYDQLAFKYLSWLLFPLLAGYACYSLIYEEHKGWYSWVLNMLYGFLLTFGFIMMTPQLFINYKLKSVAHLPWRMMSYKCLNTFIDDIFAFVIRMPTLYRIGCLRDDVVFFIFLYQRWIYKTDPSRLNEFGYSEEMEKQIKLKKQSQEQEQQAIEPTSESIDNINSGVEKSTSDKKQD